MSTDDPQLSKKLKVKEQRLSEVKGRLARLGSEEHAAVLSLMTGARGSRSLKSIQKEIEKERKRKNRLERELKRANENRLFHALLSGAIKDTEYLRTLELTTEEREYVNQMFEVLSRWCQGVNGLLAGSRLSDAQRHLYWRECPEKFLRLYRKVSETRSYAVGEYLRNLADGLSSKFAEATQTHQAQLAAVETSEAARKVKQPASGSPPIDNAAAEPESGIETVQPETDPTAQASEQAIQPPSLLYPKSAVKRAIRVILTNHPNFTDYQVCLQLDDDGFQVSSSRLKTKARSFQEMYESVGEDKHKIEVMISDVRADLRKHRLL